MEGSITNKNVKGRYAPSSPKLTKIKPSSERASDDDALEAISQHIDKSDC